jgi:tripartite-type tricarboxylate transporter receptor subunit TctC
LLLSLRRSMAAPIPERPARVIVPSHGGGTDIMGRVLSERLTSSLGKSFVVENRPGGGAMIGAELVAKSPPDGYTLLLGTSRSSRSRPRCTGADPYNPATDFWPVALLGVSPAILIANLKFPGNDVRDLIKMAKARPGKLSFASGGTGTNPHLAGELLKILAGIDMVHVPYRGGGPNRSPSSAAKSTLGLPPLRPPPPISKPNR